MVIIEWIEISLAIVGLCAAVIALLKSNQQPAIKMIGTVIGASLLGTLWAMFHTGIVMQDQAAIVAGFGVGGSVILAGLAIRRWNTSWYPAAIAFSLLIIVGIMISSVLSARPVSFPTITAPTIPSFPAAPSGSPAVVAPVAPSVSPSTTPSARPSSSRPRNRRPTVSDCAGYDDDLKASLGCP